MWGFFAALISGALMSIQGVFNTEVTRQSSLWVSTGWVQLSAFGSTGTGKSRYAHCDLTADRSVSD